MKRGRRAYIKWLYRAEDRAEELHDAGRGDLGRKEARPILDRFEAWSKGPHPAVLPECPLSEAIGYALIIGGR
jgi:hypothetical protein